MCRGTIATLLLACGLAAGNPSSVGDADDNGAQVEGFVNLTVYHVNPVTFGHAPVNMDTADVLGDAYFDLRSVALPEECAHPSNSTAHDCDNAEVTSDDLVITKLVLSVNPNYGDYGRCNICVNGSDHHGNNNCTDGKYVCSCGNFYRPTRCKPSVGKENITQHAAGRRCRRGDPNWECWKDSVATKTGGFWYSTFESGWCDSPHAGADCTWRVLKVAKIVNKSCSDNLIYDAVEAAACTANKDSCFKKCGAAVGHARNTSSSCWIGCFYDTLLGPSAATSAYNSSQGLATEAIAKMWNKPFEPEAEGGCPGLPIASNAALLPAV